MIDAILAAIFGEAVLASVRKTPNLVRALFTAFLYATVAGLLGRLLIGLPFLLSFSAVLSFFVERVAQVYLSDAHQLYSQWKELRSQVRLTLAVFAGVRIIVGQALGIYPAVTYAAFARVGGLSGLFWGRAAPVEVIFELLFTLVFGRLSYSAVISRSRVAQRTLIAVVCAGFVGITLRLLRSSS